MHKPHDKKTRTVTIQFATQADLASWSIRWLSWSDFSHVDFVLDAGTSYETFLGARFSGGVKVRPKDYEKFSRVARYEIEVTPKQYQMIHFFLADQLGKPYDWRGILNFFRHRQRNWREDDSWFCSELIAAAFEFAGVPLLALLACDHVTPRDLTLSLIAKKVWEWVAGKGQVFPAVAA